MSFASNGEEINGTVTCQVIGVTMRKKVAWYTTYENDPGEQKKLGL